MQATERGGGTQRQHPHGGQHPAQCRCQPVADAPEKRDDYPYAHSVSCATFATAFGRNPGLEQGELQDLSPGVVLMDVGKMKMPRSLLVKTGTLAPKEKEVIRKHVNLGVDLLSAEPSLTDRHRETVYFHHERHGGKRREIALKYRICAGSAAQSGPTPRRSVRPRFFDDLTILDESA